MTVSLVLLKAKNEGLYTNLLVRKKEKSYKASKRMRNWLFNLFRNKKQYELSILNNF